VPSVGDVAFVPSAGDVAFVPSAGDVASVPSAGDVASVPFAGDVAPRRLENLHNDEPIIMLPEHSDASMRTTSLVGPDRCFTTGRERPGTLIPLFGMNDKHYHLLTHAFRVHFTLNQYSFDSRLCGHDVPPDQAL